MSYRMRGGAPHQIRDRGEIRDRVEIRERGGNRNSQPSWSRDAA